jgi:hypothetical protein
MEQAERRCDRKRHTAGAVPVTWLERLQELRAEYAEALEHWQEARRGLAGHSPRTCETDGGPDLQATDGQGEEVHQATAGEGVIGAESGN